MAKPNLSSAERTILDDAFKAVAAAEEALSRVEAAGLAGCDCDGERVPTGKFRCRKVAGQDIITCHRCLGNDEWFNTTIECENGPHCSEC